MHTPFVPPMHVQLPLCSLQDMLVDLDTAKLELELANARAGEAEKRSQDSLAQARVVQQQAQGLGCMMQEAEDRWGMHAV